MKVQLLTASGRDSSSVLCAASLYRMTMMSNAISSGKRPQAWTRETRYAYGTKDIKVKLCTQPVVDVPRRPWCVTKGWVVRDAVLRQVLFGSHEYQKLLRSLLCA